MISKLNELMKIIKNLPLSKHDEILERLKKEITITEKKVENCHHCGVVGEFIKFGKKNNKQRYKCKSCNKIFTSATGTAFNYSHSTESEWREIIIDTLSGVSLRKSSKRLEIPRGRVITMRHLILNLIETYTENSETKLEGTIEIDDTYVLESVKGVKIGENYHRKPRKHGASANKRGLSNEYVSINVAVSRDGSSYSKSVNTSRPTIKDVKSVFESKINENSLIYCDGDKSFKSVFSEIANVEVVEGKFKQNKEKHINSVNGFHSQIKNKINNVYHGVATKYLNKYCAMFSLVYKNDNLDEIVDFIFNLLSLNSDKYRIKTDEIKNHNILDLGQFVNLT